MYVYFTQFYTINMYTVYLIYNKEVTDILEYIHNHIEKKYVVHFSANLLTNNAYPLKRPVFGKY